MGTTATRGGDRVFAYGAHQVPRMCDRVFLDGCTPSTFTSDRVCQGAHRASTLLRGLYVDGVLIRHATGSGCLQLVECSVVYSQLLGHLVHSKRRCDMHLRLLYASALEARFATFINVSGVSGSMAVV